MATMALPIRELSFNVQREAVSAQQAYLSAAEGIAEKRSQFFQWINVRTLNYAMGKLAKKQQRLIDCLKDSRTQMFGPEDFGRVASDLDNVVALTNSFIDEAYTMPRECVGVWSAKLTKISELNGYLDNFAESFRIASDETCTALLADIATKVTDDKLAPST